MSQLLWFETGLHAAFKQTESRQQKLDTYETDFFNKVVF
jgi:hypothetical protein